MAAVAEPKDICQTREDSIELSTQDATKYRALAARLNYLAADRTDLQYAVRRCAKRMTQPTAEDQERMKRVARYLQGRRTLDQVMKFKKRSQAIRVQTDSDWAGVENNRKSVSGGTMLVSGRWVQSSCNMSQTKSQIDLRPICIFKFICC